MTQKGLQT